MDTLSNQQILDAGLTDWRKLAQALHTRFRIPDYRAAAAFISAVAEAAEDAGHHPDVKLTYGFVNVALCTHEDGLRVTQKDVDLARKISVIARDQGLSAEPTTVTQLELALDTAHEADVAPFWAALLTGSAENRVHDSVFDPSDRVPSLWFQETEEHARPRQRWHFDLWLPPESVNERIAAAVAAGGTVLYEALSFTVLADTDGNRVCVCSQAGRD